MHTPTIPGRGLAIVAGTALYVASLSALFGEDLLAPTKWTMHHYEVVVTSLSTIAFGLLYKYAKRARMYLAAAGFAFLFVAGTCFVVYKSIGRQAAATTTQSMSADDANGFIADKMADLKTTRQRLVDAEKEVDYEQKGRPDRSGKATVKPGCGKHCEDWKRRADEVRSRIQVLEGELKTLGPRQVAAPEAEIFAQITSLFFGWTATKVKMLAILLFPVAWTLFLEYGSIWCFEYGFALGKLPKIAIGAQTSFEVANLAEAKNLLASKENPDTDPPKGGRKTSSLPENFRPQRPANNVVSISTKIAGKHPVAQALEVAGTFLSNAELAVAMGVCEGEASKRRKEVAHLIHEYRDGHRIMIGLKSWQMAIA